MGPPRLILLLTICTKTFWIDILTCIMPLYMILDIDIFSTTSYPTNLLSTD